MGLGRGGGVGGAPSALGRFEGRPPSSESDSFQPLCSVPSSALLGFFLFILGPKARVWLTQQSGSPPRDCQAQGGFTDPESSVKGMWLVVADCARHRSGVSDTVVVVLTPLTLTPSHMWPGRQGDRSDLGGKLILLQGWHPEVGGIQGWRCPLQEQGSSLSQEGCRKPGGCQRSFRGVWDHSPHPSASG